MVRNPNERYQYQPSPRLDVAEFVPSSTESLLDIGCGWGNFGAELKARRKQIEVWGIDPSPVVAPSAVRLLDNFLLGSFPEVIPSRKFSCITFNDTLEHLVDPWTALIEARKLVQQGGRLIVSLPNIRNYAVVRKLVINGRWDYQEQGILDRTHLRFFTRRSALDLLSSTGWEVLSSHPVNLAKSGRVVRLLALFGSFSREFRCQGFIFVAQASIDPPISSAK